MKGTTTVNTGRTNDRIQTIVGYICQRARAETCHAPIGFCLKAEARRVMESHWKTSPPIFLCKDSLRMMDWAVVVGARAVTTLITRLKLQLSPQMRTVRWIAWEIWPAAVLETQMGCSTAATKLMTEHSRWQRCHDSKIRNLFMMIKSQHATYSESIVNKKRGRFTKMNRTASMLMTYRWTIPRPILYKCQKTIGSSRRCRLPWGRIGSRRGEWPGEIGAWASWIAFGPPSTA